jgi:tRNA dimethylallyltransferase
VIDLIVVCGPTASGKTALGAALAERLDGEVVSADAFAVYRGLDIGTAKPDADMRARVPHHLIDIADPRERYSAGMFVRDAEAAISGIRGRGRVPVVVGGTHFYVRALLYGLFPEPPKDLLLRQKLEEQWAHDGEAVRRRLVELDPEMAARIAPADRQRILRALEVCLVAGRPMSELWREHACGSPRFRFVLLGLQPPREELRARISLRVEGMFAGGLLGEVRGLLAQGLSPGVHALKAIGYRECCQVLGGLCSVAEAQTMTQAATHKLAKRQMTWLRGERDVEWVAGMDEHAFANALARVEGRGGTAGSN